VSLNVLESIIGHSKYFRIQTTIENHW